VGRRSLFESAPVPLNKDARTKELGEREWTEDWQLNLKKIEV
jgi:hypothetical protein